MAQSQTFGTEQQTFFPLVKLAGQSELGSLLSEFLKFDNEVESFIENYEGPDYFDIHQNLKNLHIILGQCSEMLIKKGYAKEPDNFGSGKFFLNDFYLFDMAIMRNDTERIFQVVSGLRILLGKCRKNAFEAHLNEDAEMENLMNGFVWELENRQWIFSMFLKY